MSRIFVFRPVRRSCQRRHWWRTWCGRKGTRDMDTEVQPFCSVTSTVELLTHRLTGTTYVIVGDLATARDGRSLGYDIYQVAGPLSKHELRAIRRSPLSWRPAPAVNIDRLIRTMSEYARESIARSASSRTWACAERAIQLDGRLKCQDRYLLHCTLW